MADALSTKLDDIESVEIRFVDGKRVLVARGELSSIRFEVGMAGDSAYLELGLWGSAIIDRIKEDSPPSD